MTVACVRFALAVALCAAPAPDASAATTAPSDRAADRRAGAWIAAVREHEPGRPDAALLAVATWTPEEIARILPQVAADQDAARLLARGLVLHADLGIVEQASGGPGSGLAVTTLEDGRLTGQRRLSHQWRIGRTIARALIALEELAGTGGGGRDPASARRAREERRRIVRAWYLATAALLQEGGHLGFLHTHLNDGLSLLGDDAVVLMYRATIRQAFPDPRVQQFTRMQNTRAAFRVTASGPGLPTVPQQATFELDMAARDLRRALEIDPALPEARIRLAHVLSDRGRHADAAAIIRPAMDATLPVFLEYYGALILGRVEERLGRVGQARAAFERAAGAVRGAQVPRVALSRLALIEGRAPEALTALRAGDAPQGPAPPEDPWWWYFRTHEPDAATLIAEMRGAAR